jgi:LysM repeat protein
MFAYYRFCWLSTPKIFVSRIQKSLVFLFLGHLNLIAQTSQTSQTEFTTKGARAATIPANVKNYIEAYAEIAQAEQIRTNIPACIKLAQGILESSIGGSDLAKVANNHFGIKCGKDWTGATFYQMDDEVDKSCFRVYESAYDSYIQHSEFLLSKKRYNDLFELNQDDYKRWAKFLKKAGYATNPDYPNLIIQTIEKYSLFKYNVTKNDSLTVLAPTVQNIKDEDFNSIIDTAYDNKSSILFYKYNYGTILINGVPAIYAKRVESALSIAIRLAIPYKKILEFNDLNESSELIPFQYVFIQPKSKSFKKPEPTFHVVRNDESMYEIAQFYGIRLENLLTLNKLNRNQEPAQNERIYLNTQAPKTPTLRSPYFAKRTPPLQAFEKQATKDNSATIVINTEPSPPDVVPFRPANRRQPTEPEANVNQPINSVDTESLPKPPPVKPRIIVSPPAGLIGLESEVVRPTLSRETVITKTSTKHIVKEKETLYAISRFYQIKVDDIVSANQLTTISLNVGQELQIPK